MLRATTKDNDPPAGFITTQRHQLWKVVARAIRSSTKLKQATSPAEIVIRDDVDAQLPRGTALTRLPAGTLEIIKQAAAGRLAKLLIPCVLLRKAIKARAELSAARFPNSDAQRLFSPMRLRDVCQMLNNCSDSFIHELLTCATPMCFRQGEVVVYKGTPPNAVPLILLVRGTLRYTEGDSVVSATGASLLNVYEATLGIDIDHSIFAATACDCFVIQHSDFAALRRQMDAPSRMSLETVVQQTRRDLFERYKLFPDPLDLQARSEVMKSWPLDDIAAVSSHFHPKCYQDGEVILREGAVASAVLIISSGTLLVEGGTHTASSKALFEVECLFNKKWSKQTVTAGKCCNVWLLSRRELHRFLSEKRLMDLTYSDVRNFLQDTASTSPEMRVLIERAISGIPFVSHSVPQHLFRRFASLFHIRTYFPREVICSKADYCDRVIVCVDGSAIVRTESPTLFHNGESIGFTLSKRHKWLHTVAAGDVVACAEVERDALFEFLSLIPHALQRLEHKTGVLLCPSKYSVKECDTVAFELSSFKTVPMYAVDNRSSSSNTSTAQKKPPNYVNLIAPFVAFEGKALPRAAQLGESDVFFRSTSKVSGICCHSPLLVFQPKPPKAHSRAEIRLPRRLSGTSRINDAATMLTRVEGIMNAHHHKIETLWTTGPNEVKQLYGQATDGTFPRRRSSAVTSVPSSSRESAPIEFAEGFLGIQQPLPKAPKSNASSVSGLGNDST